MLPFPLASLRHAPPPPHRVQVSHYVGLGDMETRHDVYWVLSHLGKKMEVKQGYLGEVDHILTVKTASTKDLG